MANGICNTLFQKKDHQFVTYKSDNRESQIDFLLWRWEKLSEIRHCKVIKGKIVAAQHKLVVADFEFEGRKKGRQRRIEPKIKWRRLKDVELKCELKAKVLEMTRTWEGVQEWWGMNSTAIRAAGEEILGKTSGIGPPADKETWWWGGEQVQEAVKAKKMAKKKWNLSGLEEDKTAFNNVKRRAKKEVAKAKALAWREVEERGNCIE